MIVVFTHLLRHVAAKSLNQSLKIEYLLTELVDDVIFTIVFQVVIVGFTVIVAVCLSTFDQI